MKFVSFLFTNVPISGTINILVDKAFTDDWFIQTYNLNLEKEEFAQLLEVATTNQLFSSMVICMSRLMV